MTKNAAVIFDKDTKQPLMVIIPDSEAELKDVAFNQSGTIQILVPLDEYKNLSYDGLSEIINKAAIS